MWIEMLGCLKRNKGLNYQEGYDMVIQGYEGIKLCKYGDEYIVVEDNHRSCYAKFLGMKTMKVDTVTEYHINDFYYMFNKELTNRGLFISEWNNTRYIIKLNKKQIKHVFNQINYCFIQII